MKLVPRHKSLPGNAGESYKNRVKKSRIKQDMAKKTKKQQRKRSRG